MRSPITRKCIGVLITAAFALSPAMAQTEEPKPPKPQAVSLYNLGLNAYKQGSPESAIIFFRRATDLDPNLADAHYNLGVIFQTQKRFNEATSRFEEVLRIKPTDPDAHYQLGVIFQEQGQWAKSRQHLSTIAPNNPHFADAQKRLSQLNSRQTSPQQAYQPPAAYGKPQAPAQTPQSSYQPYNGAQQSQQTAIGYQASNRLSGTQNPGSPYSQPPAKPPAVAVQPHQLGQPTGTAYAQAPVGQSKTTPNPVPVLANTSLKVIAKGFSAPAGLAFDKLGNLYIANFLSNSVDRINPDGSRSQFSSGANLQGPIGLTVDEYGNVYVANYNGGNVARINPAGISTIIATGFRKPYYLTLDKDGNLYVSQQEDNSVVRIVLPRPIGIGSRPE